MPNIVIQSQNDLKYHSNMYLTDIHQQNKASLTKPFFFYRYIINKTTMNVNINGPSIHIFKSYPAKFDIDINKS